MNVIILGGFFRFIKLGGVLLLIFCFCLGVWLLIMIIIFYVI